MRILHNVSFALLILCSIYLSSGCTHIPSTRAVQIVRAGNHLYVGTNLQSRSLTGTSAYINLYNVDKNRWEDKLTLPKVEEAAIEKMIVNNGVVYVQQKGNWKNNGGIYRISKNGNFDRIVELDHFESLAGIDDEYFYVTEMKYLSNPDIKANNWMFQPAKYNKRTGARIEYHFEKNQDLVVRDVWEDDQNYWYACFQGGKPQKYNIPSGNLVLVNKSKTDGKIDINKLEVGDWIFDGKIIGDKDSIWIFRSPRDNSASIKYHFVKFSKKDKVFQPNNDIKFSKLIPFIPNQDNENDKYLWILDTSSSTAQIKIDRIEKVSLTRSKIDLNNISNSNSTRTTGTTYADEDYLWLDAYKLKSYAPTGNTVPYLLKISKKDLSYELIYIEPTMADSIKTILNNFFFWFWIPFFRG